jgi:hypothetical protein
MSLQTVDSVNSVIQNLNKTTNQINILITDTQDIIKVLPSIKCNYYYFINYYNLCNI